MAADARGLVHGGFTFGLADYAAMLAVNEPTVVLARAETKFLGPVVAGERLEAEATVERTDGKKHWVKVVVRRAGAPVMEGTVLAVVPDRHILDVAKEPPLKGRRQRIPVSIETSRRVSAPARIVTVRGSCFVNPIGGSDSALTS
ncbi:MAG: thioesterase family protein [Candidatus Rokubacteria bacterium]|nr:thioesterase family protein [Candidatus Rokubacteria bacterium]